LLSGCAGSRSGSRGPIAAEAALQRGSPASCFGPASAAKAAGDLDVGIAEVRRVVAESPRSAELIARLPDEVMLQGMMNRCHNTVQEPMDIPRAQWFPASAIRRAIWSAWSRAPRLSRSFSPGGREGTDTWQWSPGRRQDRHRVSAVISA
jgi:hypothetical protein